MISHGIRIDVETRFIPKESDPARQRYLFAYTITIHNDGEQPGQLLNRHWWVTDGQGEVQEVEGPGVIGQQPRIRPGESFRYTSAAMLSTPVGTMHGHYRFQRDDGEGFEVAIPLFSLRMLSAVH